MSQSEHRQEGAGIDHLDQLRHDLMNPLASIRGRAQLLTRAVERSTAMDDDERARLLRGLAAIDHAVLAAVEVLDQADAQHSGGQGWRPRESNDR